VQGSRNGQGGQTRLVAMAENKESRHARLRMANGYGIFSVGFSQIEDVKNYIAGQEEHHRKLSFQDEFREFLRRYEIQFDERYVWD
jgi:hypothetical protein